MARKAIDLTPAEILAQHGIAERHARTLVSVYFEETWPRIARVLRDRGLRGSHSRLQAGRPWPHAAAFNLFIREFCTAGSSAAATQIARPMPDVLIRRLGGVTAAFLLFGDQDSDGPAYILPDVTSAERSCARSTIAGLLTVDDTGLPLGLVSVDWFAEWQVAMMRTCGQFLSHARMARSMP